MGQWITKVSEERERECSNRRTELLGERDFHPFGKRNELAGVEKKSIYNKKKWLLACQQTDFRISHYCCNVMKKLPLKQYQREHKVLPILGTMTSESKLREQAWIRHGCNAWESSNPTSQPLSFWTTEDVLLYLSDKNIPICSVYGDIVVEETETERHAHCTGCDRTGCIFCGFGAHLRNDQRFINLAKTHPRQYEYCLYGGQYVDNPSYDPTAPKIDPVDGWLNWNPKKIWVPSKEGLGMKHVFDEMNQLYGKIISYE